MKGLIVKGKWADLILSGEKTLELRGSNTKIRGKIGIIKSGTKRIYGTVELVGSVRLGEEDFERLKEEHKVECKFSEIPYSHLYGWVLKNNEKFEEPVRYNHKTGCVIWVNIEE